MEIIREFECEYCGAVRPCSQVQKFQMSQEKYVKCWNCGMQNQLLPMQKTEFV